MRTLKKFNSRLLKQLRLLQIAVSNGNNSYKQKIYFFKSFIYSPGVLSQNLLKQYFCCSQLCISWHQYYRINSQTFIRGIPIKKWKYLQKLVVRFFNVMYHVWRHYVFYKHFSKTASAWMGKQENRLKFTLKSTLPKFSIYIDSFKS